MPFPPPPNAALTTIGYPMRSASFCASSGVTGSSVPGTIGAPTRLAVFRAVTLSPIISMASGGGPTNDRPASSTALANAAFSARNP